MLPSRSIIWLLLACLVCLIAAVAQAKTTAAVVKPLRSKGRRVPLHQLTESQYEHILRMMNKPSISRARLISASNPNNSREQSRTLNSNDFNSNFFNLLRVIRFENTDSPKIRLDNSNTPLCVIKVTDNKVETPRSNSDAVTDDSNGVKCVVVVKGEKEDEEEKKRLAFFAGGAGMNNWGPNDWGTNNWGDKWQSGDVTYKPVYRPYYVPYPIPYHGHKHNHNHGRNVPSQTKFTTGIQTRPYKVDQHVRKALQEYYERTNQANAGDDENLEPSSATTKSQLGPFDPYGVYGSLYNPTMFYSPYQAAAGASTVTFATPNNPKSVQLPSLNPNYQFIPPYLLNANQNLATESRSYKRIAAVDADEESNDYAESEAEEQDDDDDEEDF